MFNTHAVKAGLSVERARKDQNFQNNENVEMIYSNWGNGTTGNVFADTLTARPSQVTGRHRLARSATSSCGTSTASSRTPGR